MEIKVSEAFKDVLIEHLNEVAKNDKVFAEKYANPEKKIEDCIQFIGNKVKDLGVHGFASKEIYGMAIHYYDEEAVDIGKAIQMTVKVDRHVEITEEEKEKLRQEARQKIIDEERQKMKSKNIGKKKSTSSQEPGTTGQSSMF